MQQFTGGNNLTGIKQYYHLAMMSNELAGGTGAYQLSFAQRGNSGLSFGGNQLDIAHNDTGAIIFMEIILEAKDNEGKPLFNNSEIAFIATNMRTQGKTPEQVFGSELLDKINNALSSPDGVKRIDLVYAQEIDDKADFIAGSIARITHSPSDIFYKTALGQVLLFDYNNQYNIDIGSLIEDYINGQSVTLYTGKVLTIKDSCTFDNHKDFIYNLKYASTSEGNMRDANRRLGNIVSILCQDSHKQNDKPNTWACTCQYADFSNCNYLEQDTYLNHAYA